MSSPALFPIALNLIGKPCLVVGAGAVAARKVKSLVDCGAIVTIVAPVISVAFIELEEFCTIHRRDFETTDCRGQHLVFACTDSRDVNARVAGEARSAGAWCNVADGGDSDFQVMATVRSGPVTVGVSTGGASPALARHVKERIGDSIGPEYGVLAELLAKRRIALKDTVDAQEDRAGLWREILAGEALNLLRAGKRADAERLVDDILRKP